MDQRALVCGSRDFKDRALVYRVLDVVRSRFLVDAWMHGGYRGVDRLTDDWANDRNVECRPFPADWDQHGRRAGPIRNQEMIDVGQPTVGIAFPGGPGTADMIERLHTHEIPVYEVRINVDNDGLHGTLHRLRRPGDRAGRADA